MPITQITQSGGREMFTASGSWTCPAGVTTAYLTGRAGGGGGRGTTGNGGAGGSTSFGALLTLTGGGGGTTTAGGAGGSGGNLNGIAGQGGVGSLSNTDPKPVSSSSAGVPGGLWAGSAVAGISAPANSGHGGTGCLLAASINGAGGQGGGAYKQAVTVVPGTVYTVTIGAAGAAGSGAQLGGAGGSGFLLVEW